MKLFTILRNMITKAKAYTDTKFGLMADYIVEQNTSSGWTYRKWNSGVAECWAVETRTLNFNNSTSGGLSWTSGTLSFISDFFTAQPSLQILVGNDSGVFASPSSLTKDSASVFYICMGYGYKSTTLSYYAIGTWK